jgi:hypothetical protein
LILYGKPFFKSCLFALQSYTLEGLAVYTQYLVSLRVYNPEGSGPETIVVVMTDEGGESLDTSLPIPRMYTGKSGDVFCQSVCLVLLRMTFYVTEGNIMYLTDGC